MPRPSSRLVIAVALGGAVGAVLRWAAGTLVADGDGFPWTTFAVNVVGSLLLGALPALAVVRRSPTLTAGAGAGLLGGFTTLSAASEQTRALLDSGRVLLGGGYLLGTLAACLLAVSLASYLSGAAAQARVAREGGDQ